MSPDDAKAVAAYVRSVMETIGRQGMPPSVGKAPPSVLVGDAARGPGILRPRSAPAATPPPAICKGIATRISDPKTAAEYLGGGRRRADGVDAAAAAAAEPSARR